MESLSTLLHWLTQIWRVLAAGCLLLGLVRSGVLIRRVIGDGQRRGWVRESLLDLAVGAAAVSGLVRILAWLGFARTWVLVPLFLMLPWVAGVPAPSNWLPAALGRRVDARWLLALPVLLVPLFLALSPAVSSDALSYHLRFPEMTLWSGRWMVDAANSTSHFPSAMGALYLVTLAVDSSGIAAQLVHYGFFLATAAACFQLARRLAGPHAGWFAVLLLGAMPAVTVVAGYSWADLGVTFGILAALLAMVSGRHGAAAAALGFAGAAKYSGLLFGLPLAGLLLYLAARDRAWRRLLAGTAVGFAAMLPWYLANLVRTGNPFHPFLAGVFGTSGVSSETLLHWEGLAVSGHAGGLPGYFLAPVSLDADLGGLPMLALLALALASTAFSKRFRLPGLLAALSLAPFLFLQPAARILLPPLAGLAVLAGSFLASLRGRLPRASAWALVVFMVGRGLAVTMVVVSTFSPFAWLAGMESEAAFRRRNQGLFPLSRDADVRLPAGAHVLVEGWWELFGFPRTTSAAAMTDPPAWRTVLGDAAVDAEKALGRLKTQGFTHLLVAREVLDDSAPSSLWRSHQLTEDELTALKWVLRGSTPLSTRGEAFLFALPETRPPCISADPPVTR